MHSLPGGGGESVNCMDNTGIMWGKQYHCISHVYIIYRDMLDLLREWEEVEKKT